ncbi:WD repeat-containing protein 37 [Operophtera brumata]|uniref:WD repeat-containing protein 37 n=1 Tax=Operophtera brumata TaxID=104452 RepID=A0A0L7KMC3_OPEBR|nr:WD repeat-containing protein 37 [Operophtera brumata]
MKSSKRRLQALTEVSDGMPSYLKMEDSETSIPPVFRLRLHELFSQIEKEFDLLYNENLNYHTACVWSVEWAKCLLQYTGHAGSVNSIKFHPSRDIALTSSGDNTAHVWQAAVNWDLPRGQSSEEELELGGEESLGEGGERPEVLRTPLMELVGHQGVVVAADWLTGGDHVITASRLVVTASRDTTFRLWDFREPIHSVSVFQGHTE